MAFQYRPFNNRQGTGSPCAGATGAACGTPADAGIPQVYNAQNAGCACWTARAFFAPSGTNAGGPNVDRSSTVPSADPNFVPANHWTFYARTGLVGLAFSHTGDGTYGSDWCGGSIGGNAGTINGWECDPAQWNLDANGAHQQNPVPNSGTSFYYVGEVGMRFQARDVDCFDDTLVQSSATPANADVGAHSVPFATKAANACQ
jgi:hypothetical protein